jgi:hypothetical protein
MTKKRVKQTGRPKKVGGKMEPVGLRVHPLEEQFWRDCCNSVGVDFSEWARKTLTASASDMTGRKFDLIQAIINDSRAQRQG